MASSALAQSLLLPGLVVSSHHGQQQVQGRSNHKKPIAPQASLGPLATRGGGGGGGGGVGSSSGQIRSSSCCRSSRKRTTIVAAAVAFHSFSGMRRAVAIDSLSSSVGGRGKDFSSVVAAALDVKRRQYGGPWTTPAAKRGVVTAMFERFTEKAIKVIMLAQEEARRLGHNFVGTEQILLGLIGEGTGIAAKVLKSMGVNLKEARVEVEKIIGRGSGFVAVEIPFTPRAKRVLELSLEEARQLGHNYIGTEHLLLGLLREGEGVAARVLENLGADPSNIRTQACTPYHLVGPTHPPTLPSLFV
jgi:ATP-dependent Clp protease ATP-binding subunit ClpC